MPLAKNKKLQTSRRRWSIVSDIVFFFFLTSQIELVLNEKVCSSSAQDVSRKCKATKFKDNT